MEDMEILWKDLEVFSSIGSLEIWKLPVHSEVLITFGS